ncbi:MAG TPA: hypothetical protein VKH63_04705, partial [Candidatus Acidoferrum sp.]|nr:hypothetical protein [Candidatus Acidoferrum sp.]
HGRLFRCVCRTGTIWGTEMTEKVVWHVVKQYAGQVGIVKLAPHDLRSYAESRTMPNARFLRAIVKLAAINDSA